MTGSISNVLTYQMDPNGYWNIPTANSTQLVLNPTFTNTGPEEVTNGDFSQTVLGSELVVNGDFLSASSWNVNPNWSINTALGVAEADGLSNADINQSVWLPVIGKSYKVTFEVVSRSQGEVLFILGGVTGQAHNTLGIKTEYIVATSTDRLKIDSEDSFIGSVTNVSVKEVLQLVTNGDFTEGTEGVAGGNFEGGLIGTVANSGGAVYTWALNTVAPISGTQDGKLAVTTVGTSTDYPRLGFNGNLALDKSYVLTFDYKVNSGTCYMPTINRGGGSSAYVASTLSGSGTYTFYFQGFGTGDLTLNFRGTNLFDTQLDNVSVKELGVDWTVVDGAGGDTVTFGDSFAEIIKTAGTVVYLQQDYAVTLGASHKLTYTVVENTFTGGGTELGLSGVGAYGGSTLDSSASATPKTVYLTVTDDTPLAALRFYSGDTGGSIKITDISVQELGEGWTVTMSDGSAPTATKYVEFVEAGARFVSDVTAAPFLYLNQNVLSVGKLYKLTCSVAYTGTGGIKAYVGGESFPLTEGVNTFYTSSLSTNSEFRFLRNNTDVDCIISNISVEETGLDWVSPDAGVVNTFSATGLTMTSVNGTGSNTISQSGVTADDQAYKVVYTILGSNLTSGGYLEFYNGTGYMSMPTTIGTNTLHFTRNGTDDAVYLRLSSSSGSTTDTVDIGSITIVEVQGWTLEDGKLVGDLPDLAKSATQGIGAIAGNSYKATMDVAIAEEELITNGSFREVGINLTSPLDFTTWLDSSTSSITANSFTTVGSGGGVYFDLTTNKIYKINVSGVTGDVSLRSRDGGGAGTVLGAFDTDLYFDTNGLGSPNIYIRSNSATTATVTSVSVQEVGQGWGLGAGWSIGDGVVTAASAGAAPISQVVSGFTAGRTYKVKFEVTAVTQGYVRVYAYVGASGAFSNIFSSPTLQTGEYEVDFVFGGTDKTLRFYGSTGGGSDFAGSITNVSVEEVGELKVDIGGAPVQSITTSGTHSLTFTAVDSDPFRIYGSTFTGSVTNIFVTQVAGDTLERWWRVNGNIDTLTDPAPNVASNGIANSITWFNSPLISSDTP
jgi:hypothetical protein